MSTFDRTILVIAAIIVVESGISVALLYGSGAWWVVALKLVGGILAVLVALVIYFVPTIVAAQRDTPLLAPVLVLNVFLGWTWVGWVVALMLAVWPMEPLEVKHD